MTDHGAYGAGQYAQAQNGEWQQAWAGYEQPSSDPNAYTYSADAGQQLQAYDNSGAGQTGGYQDPNQYAQQMPAGTGEEEGEYMYADAPDAYPDRRPDLVDQEGAEESPRPSLAAVLNFDEPDNEKNLIRDADGRPKAVSFAKLIGLITHAKEPGMFLCSFYFWNLSFS